MNDADEQKEKEMKKIILLFYLVIKLGILFELNKKKQSRRGREWGRKKIAKPVHNKEIISSEI